MNVFVADPHWGWWVIVYFFLGGIAGGGYFVACLVDWVGNEDDRRLTQVAYWLAFPLIAVCGVLLVVDLYRPERFWHMLFKSEVVKGAWAAGFPFSGDGWRLASRAVAFKYWSPMSTGAWGITVFGACAAISFVAVVWPHRRPGVWLQRGWPIRVVQSVGCLAGFYVASYTGTLLSATNQPIWSDTAWLGSAFLVSGVSTALATIMLVGGWKKLGNAAARTRLADAEAWTIGVELVVIALFLLSLRDNLNVLLLTWRGQLLLVGVMGLGLLLPLALHVSSRRHASRRAYLAGALVLLGGFLLRYTVDMVPVEVLRSSPAVLSGFGPEDRRVRGGDEGADVGNYVQGVEPRSKMPIAEP